ncbi:MAG: hypothetical protein KIT34_15505 [Cyanobacteria bacterium TGS_CYA1]|nr:hypothetical protein [Cyanobacteria bacterium TGS_CYA1]
MSHSRLTAQYHTSMKIPYLAILALATIALSSQIARAEPELQMHGTDLFSNLSFPLGIVTDIKTANGEIYVSGTKGAFRADQYNSIKTHIKFQDYPSETRIVRIFPSGDCEYLNRGSWGDNSCLFNSDGKRRWYLHNGKCIDVNTSTAPKDKTEKHFLLAVLGGKGVTALSPSGKILWSGKEHDNLWQAEVARADDPSKSKIINTTGRGKYRIRNNRGHLIREIDSNEYAAHFSICRFPRNATEDSIIECQKGFFWIMNTNGELLLKLEAPSTTDNSKVKCVNLKLKDSQDDYLAILAFSHHYSANQSILLIYDSKGKLVFQEIIHEDCSAIEAIHSLNDENEYLLVGGKDRVIKFSLPDSLGEPNHLLPSKKPPLQLETVLISFGCGDKI